MAESTGIVTRKFAKGEVLLKEGELHDSVFLITKGKVEVRKGKLKDCPHVFGVKGPGTIIGEMAAFDDTPHMATVVALEDTTATVMTRKDFQRRMTGMDPIVRGAILAIVQRAREMAETVIAQKGPKLSWKIKQRR